MRRQANYESAVAKDIAAIFPEPVGHAPGVLRIEAELVLPRLVAIVRQLDRQAVAPASLSTKAAHLSGIRDLAVPVPIDPMANLGIAAIEPVDGAPPMGVAASEELFLCDGHGGEGNGRLVGVGRKTLAGQPQQRSVLSAQAGEGGLGLPLLVMPSGRNPRRRTMWQAHGSRWRQSCRRR